MTATNPKSGNPMKTVTAKQAHTNLGQVLDDSQHEPVLIQKNGKPFSVVVSIKDFEDQERLRMMEEARIDARIAKAEARGGEIPSEVAFENVRTKLIAENGF